MAYFLLDEYFLFFYVFESKRNNLGREIDGAKIVSRCKRARVILYTIVNSSFADFLYGPDCILPWPHQLLFFMAPLFYH